MKTTAIKRFRCHSEAEADAYAIKMRRRGRSAWAEESAGKHYLCLRVEIRRAWDLRPIHLWN